MKSFLQLLSGRPNSFLCNPEDIENLLDEQHIKALLSAEILTREESTEGINCPHCGEHAVSPIFKKTIDEKIKQYVITCTHTSIGTQYVEDDFFRYQVRVDSLIKFLRKAFSITEYNENRWGGNIHALGKIKTDQGNVQCWLTFTEDLTESEKKDIERSIPALLLNNEDRTPKFQVKVSTRDILRLLGIKRNKLEIDMRAFRTAVQEAFGKNYYKDHSLYINGVQAGYFEPKSLTDIVLEYMSTPENIDRPIQHEEIFEHYKKVTKSTSKVEENQWFASFKSKLAEKLKKDKSFVDNFIKKAGKKNAKSSSFFYSGK